MDRTWSELAAACVFGLAALAPFAALDARFERRRAQRWARRTEACLDLVRLSIGTGKEAGHGE